MTMGATASPRSIVRLSPGPFDPGFDAMRDDEEYYGVLGKGRALLCSWGTNFLPATCLLRNGPLQPRKDLGKWDRDPFSG